MKYGLSDEVIAKINSVLSKHKAVEQAVLYGSRAKGNFKDGSDIDLTLKGNIGFEEFAKIDRELNDLLLPWIIDLSVYSHINNKNLIEHIERVGKIFLQN
jgi:predicted nucleotidyltransferase